MLHVEPVELDDATLENWCRWHWSGLRTRASRCMSLEHNWRPKQHWEAPPVTPLGRVDQRSAQDVEEAWKTLPFLEKMLLKWHYVFKRTPGAICRSLRQRGYAVTTIRYMPLVEHSRALLTKALALQKKTDDTRAQRCSLRPVALLEGDVRSIEARRPRAFCVSGLA